LLKETSKIGLRVISFIMSNGVHAPNPYEGAYEVTTKDCETLSQEQLKLKRKAVENTYRIWGYNPFMNEGDCRGFYDVGSDNLVIDALRGAYGFTRESEINRGTMYIEGGYCLYVIQPGDDGFKIFGELVSTMLSTSEKWRNENKLSSLLRRPEDGSYTSRKVITEDKECPLFYTTEVVTRPLEELEIPFSVRTKLECGATPTKYTPVYIGFTCSRSVQFIMRNNLYEKRVIFKFDDRYAETMCHRDICLYHSARDLFSRMHASIVCPFIQKLSDNNRWRWEQHDRRSVILHRAGVRKTRRLGK
jgi:hypothetical protein